MYFSEIISAPCHSHYWQAPEVYGRLPYNEKVDTFSFGVLMYEVGLPWNGQSAVMIHTSRRVEQIKPVCLHDLPEQTCASVAHAVSSAATGGLRDVQ